MMKTPKSKSHSHQPSANETSDLRPINPNAAGIDMVQNFTLVSVPKDTASESVRCFGCYTADLYALADWLAECGVKTVAMESTGVYWIALFQILETRGNES